MNHHSLPQVHSQLPQNHPPTYPSTHYHSQRPVQQMRARQTYTVISQTRGENATKTHILATECARLDTIPQSPRSHQEIPNENYQQQHTNMETQRHSEKQVTERQTNSQTQINRGNINTQTNILNKCATRPKVRTNQQESHTHTKKRPQSHAISPIYHNPNLQLPKPNNHRHAPSDPNLNHNIHTSNFHLPQQKFETKKEEPHNQSVNNMDEFIGAIASSPLGHSSLTGRKSPKISIDLNPEDENKSINNEGQLFNTDILRFFAAKDAHDFLQRNRLPEEQRFSGDSKVDFESVLMRFETITDNSGIPAGELIFELKHYFLGEAAKICELY